MLFNAEMIDSFLDVFQKSSDIAENEWRISHAKLASGAEDGESSVLYIGPGESGTVLCRNGENRFTVHNAQVSDVFNTVADRMNYYNQWENRALNVVHDGMDSRESVTMLAELFRDYDVNVVTPLGRFLFSTQNKPERYIDSSLISILRSIPSCYTICLGIKGVTLFWEPEFYRKNVMLGNIVFSDDTYYIFSVIEKDRPITDTEIHLARLAQSIFEKLEITMEQKSTFSPFESTLTSLLSGGAVSEAMLKNLEVLWDYKIADGACLVLIRNSKNQKFGIKAMASSINDKISAAFAFTYEKQVLCLLPFENLYRNCGILESLTEASRSEITFSTSFDSWHKLPDIYRHMNQMRRRLEEQGRAKRVIYCADYMMDHYLWTLSAQEGSMLVHPDIVRLKALGDNNRFLDTFYCFLSNNCKMSATAEKLHIHVSTLKYRMEKVYSTVSLDPEDYQGRMAFLLSYDLMKAAEKKAGKE